MDAITEKWVLMLEDYLRNKCHVMVLDFFFGQISVVL